MQVRYEADAVVPCLCDASAVSQESVAGFSTPINGEISRGAVSRDGPILELSIRRLIDHPRLQPQQIDVTPAIQRERKHFLASDHVAHLRGSSLYLDRLGRNLHGLRLGPQRQLSIGPQPLIDEQRNARLRVRLESV